MLDPIDSKSSLIVLFDSFINISPGQGGDWGDGPPARRDGRHGRPLRLAPGAEVAPDKGGILNTRPRTK